MDVFATAEDYELLTGRTQDDRTNDILAYASAYIISEGERAVPPVDVAARSAADEAYAANLTRITCNVAAQILDMQESNDVSQESFTIGSFTSSQSFGSGTRGLLSRMDRDVLGLPRRSQRVSSVLVGAQS